MTFFVDRREKNIEPILKYLEKHGIECRDELLEAGDYVFYTEDDRKVVIERSRFSDFVGKIYSKRLWKQLEKMESDGDILVFIIENPYSLKYTKIQKEVLYGALIYLQQKAQVYITNNKTETAIVLRLLYERYNGKKKRYLTKKKFAKTKEEEAVEMLMGIRGIGLKTALEILSEFGTVKNVVNASKPELERVVGKSLSEHILEVVNADVRLVVQEKNNYAEADKR